jgi:ElaB/YqjD/DUF883 family membrane-anchored ribosome-binding protein
MAQQASTGPSPTERVAEVRDELRDRAHEVDHATQDFVTEHPFLAVGGALVAGFFLARLIAKR